MWTTGRSVRLLMAIMLFTVSFALQGCRKDEQGRITSFEQGKYLGKPDQKLSDVQLDRLRQRARMGHQL